MSNRPFGWDLPPGVNVSDIPGNRPEDEVWDNILDDFYTKLEEKHQAMLETHIVRFWEEMYEVVDQAIQYGIELGKLDQMKCEQEATFYMFQHLRECINKVRSSFPAPDHIYTRILTILNNVEHGKEGAHHEHTHLTSQPNPDSAAGSPEPDRGRGTSQE
jgi:hypothetical protein